MRKWLSLLLVFAGLIFGFSCKHSTTPELPTIASFTATPATIHSGESSTLAWNTSGATSLAIDNGVGTVTGATGTKSVSPTVTTTYKLTATNEDGTATKTVVVTVEAALPTIDSFVATPDSIKLGDSSTLSWTVTNGTTITIDNGIGTVAATGTQSVSPTATTTYTLSATNGGGTVTSTAQVAIKPQAEVALTFNPAPPVFTFDSGTNTTSGTFAEILTESHGVAATIDDSWTGLYLTEDSSSRIASENWGGGALAANGTLTLGPHTISGTGGQAIIYAVRVSGADANGYPVLIQFYGNISWVGATGTVHLQQVVPGLTSPRIMQLFEDLKIRKR